MFDKWTMTYYFQFRKLYPELLLHCNYVWVYFTIIGTTDYFGFFNIGNCVVTKIFHNYYFLIWVKYISQILIVNFNFNYFSLVKHH
jgi:hypothetical protein